VSAAAATDQLARGSTKTSTAIKWHALPPMAKAWRTTWW
jgi:hypothetical protein